MDEFGKSRRAWQAWRALPRRRGEPPPIRELERAHQISNAQLNKLINGLSKRPSYGEIVKMAAALRTTPEWIESGTGPGPAMHQAPEEWPGKRVPNPRPKKTGSVRKAAKRA